MKQAWYQRYAARIFALAMVATLYAFARLPVVSPGERADLAGRFRFTVAALPGIPGTPLMQVRAVQPSLEHISAWISAVGGAVALYDLDGDGLPNDACYVDTRTNQVIVAPVPGTGDRYLPFALQPAPLSYDPSTMAPMGCLAGDLNEDGRPDIVVYFWGRTPIAYLRNGTSRLGNDAFVRQEIVRTGERWYTNAALFADLDGDGHFDLVIGNYFPDGARILDTGASEPQAMQHSMSRAENGGRKHLLLWAGATAGDAPSVRFVDASDALASDVATSWTLAIGAADLDGDQLPELYIANDFGPDRLLHNLSTPGKLRFESLVGKKTFTTPNSKVLGRDSFKGMGVDFADLNGDGLPDILVSNIAAEFSLLESNFVWISTGEIARMKDGIAPYVDKSEPLGLSRGGWGWDVRAADFDNDGVLEVFQAAGFVRGEVNRWPELQELAMGNDELLSHPGSWPRIQPGDDLSGHHHNPFFVRTREGVYVDVAPDLALEPRDRPYVSRGIAVADVDGDGRLDFAVANQWEGSVFYHNESPSQANSFLGLHVRLAGEGVPTTQVIRGHPDLSLPPSRPAIGAAARITTSEGRQFVAQVDGGSGHSGKRSPDLHFGLGRLQPGTLLRVDIQWRDLGGVHHEHLAMEPGWHTVLLGAGESVKE